MEPGQIICDNCGARFPAGDDLCPRCGAMKPVRVFMVMCMGLAVWGAIGALIWWLDG